MDEPTYVTQRDYFGCNEVVDVTVYNIKIMCSSPGCFQMRYIKSSDRQQSTMCKPCSRIARLKSRAKRARDARKRRGNTKRAAP